MPKHIKNEDCCYKFYVFFQYICQMICKPTMIFFDELDSTNVYLAEHFNQYHSGTIVYTHRQLKGKGLGENKWESSDNDNITLSYLLKESKVNAYRQFAINMKVALAIHDFLQKETHQSFAIKWPNDILFEGKKICGILINHFLMGEKVMASIIGIGMNINQTKFQPHIPNPISLKQITGQDYSLLSLINQFSVQLFNALENKLEYDWDTLKKEYLNRLYRYNKWADYIVRNEKIHAKITGVNEFGLLTLIDAENKIYECDLKEVVYL